MIDTIKAIGVKVKQVKISPLSPSNKILLKAKLFNKKNYTYLIILITTLAYVANIACLHF